MLNLPQKTFNKLKNILLRQQKDIESNLASIVKDDPVVETSVAQSSEPGTDSWMAEVHGRVLALKKNLEHLLLKTRVALANLQSGRYGKCDVCGKQIEIERLEAIPTATLCLVCSKKGRH